MKVMGGVSDKSLFICEEMMSEYINYGGLVIIGFYVKKIMEQFEELKKFGVVEFVEFNVYFVLEFD